MLTWSGVRIVTVVVLLFTWTLTTHGKFSVSGDEPHYLMIAESLRSDGNLDLANNYAEDDGRLFGHENLPVELHAARARNGELRSIHAIGIAVLILPVYFAAQQLTGLISEDRLGAFQMNRGLFVYSIVSLFLILLTSIGLSLLAIGLSNITTPVQAKAIAIAVGISPPVLSHSFLIFPEVFALFVSCCVVWLVTKAPAKRDPQWLMLVLLGIGVMPWFQQKFLLYALGLLLVIAVRRFELLRELRATHRAGAIAVAALPPISALLWLRFEWGTVGGALTAGLLTRPQIPFAIDVFRRGVVGLLFDRQSGLLAFGPLFWIVPAAIVLTWKHSRDLLIAFACLYLPAAAFMIGWWAGFSPAARYLVPAVPLLTIPIALAMRAEVVRRVAAGLLAFQLCISAVAWQHPRWLWPSTEYNRVLDALWWPGRIYAGILSPIRLEGITPQTAVPIIMAVILTTTIVLMAKRDLQSS